MSVIGGVFGLVFSFVASTYAAKWLLPPVFIRWRVRMVMMAHLLMVVTGTMLISRATGGILP